MFLQMFSDRILSQMQFTIKWFCFTHGGEERGTPYNGLYGEAPPERGIFFRLQVYGRVGVLLVEVYERIGNSVIWVCERA